jgi:hypothetical protein
MIGAKVRYGESRGRILSLLAMAVLFVGVAGPAQAVAVDPEASSPALTAVDPIDTVGETEPTDEFYPEDEDGLGNFDKDAAAQEEDTDLPSQSLDAGANSFVSSVDSVKNDIAGSGCTDEAQRCVRVVPDTDVSDADWEPLLTATELTRLVPPSAQLSDLTPTELAQVKEAIKSTQPVGTTSTGGDGGSSPDVPLATLPETDRFGSTGVEEVTAGVSDVAAAAARTLKPPARVALPKWCTDAIAKKGYKQRWLTHRFDACRGQGLRYTDEIKIGNGPWVVVGYLRTYEYDYLYMPRNRNIWYYQHMLVTRQVSGTMVNARAGGDGGCSFPASGCRSAASYPDQYVGAVKAFAWGSMALTYTLSRGIRDWHTGYPTGSRTQWNLKPRPQGHSHRAVR